MKKIKTIRINTMFILSVVFIFLCIIFKLVWVGTGNIEVNGRALSAFANDRDTVKRVTTAPRGTIYSGNDEILAKNVNSYTVIAILSESRTKDPENPYHVVDKELTAEKLSPLINMTKERILSLLNTKIKDCDSNGNNCELITPYQVELGPGGRGISELTKDQIDTLDLPGIEFVGSTKRYYPNGNFLSYTLGYAKSNDDGDYIGEMGVELFYNEELTGKNGYIEFQADTQGYQITSVPNVEQKATPGNDIYLTIDTNIQMFAEQAMNKLEEHELEWATISVMNAKTGEILGVASSPSFDNNTLEITSYYDPFVSNTYEPGSTMKIFSFMAAMDNGAYDGNAKYKSGRLKVDDATIKDHNGVGWGEITYDQGFHGSSNVAASLLALNIGRAKLTDYYTALGFGKPTGISLPEESKGTIKFRYNTEIVSASYGQGITVTAVQMLQALSVLGNNGVMIKPYIVSKVVDSSTGEVLVENKREEVAKISSPETVEKMIDLMRGVVDGRSSMSTGKGYYIEGYDLVGKTGTAEIASGGSYLKGEYIRSFAGLFPGDDPEIVVYAAASKLDSSSALKTSIKSLVKDVGTYLNIYGDVKETDEESFKVDSYINKNTKDITELLNKKTMTPIVIGEGEKVINQYPQKNTTLNLKNKVFILTNSANYKMVDITGWSRNEVSTYAKLLGLDVSFEGYGYVKEFNIQKDTIIDKNVKLEVKLETKFNETKDEAKKDEKKE